LRKQGKCAEYICIAYIYYEVNIKSREYLEKEYILTKTYEDGIMDALMIIKRYTDVAVYNVPTVYIEEALINHLPSGYKLDLIDIKGNLKKSREVWHNV
jgi:hypothetical protein